MYRCQSEGYHARFLGYFSLNPEALTPYSTGALDWEFQRKSLNLYGEQLMRHSFMEMISCTVYCNRRCVLLCKHMFPDIPGFTLRVELVINF